MSNYTRLVTTICLLWSANAFAFDFFFDSIFWQATETVDWALTNNLSTPNQVIGYQTVDFPNEPGFRVGFTLNREWENKFYYTWYYVTTTGSATGNLTSTFMGGKISQGSNFYSSGQYNFSIIFNMFDWDLSKSLYASEKIIFHPIIGLRGGWIHQSINTSFQGTTSVNEYVKNNFSGIGPKIALESNWILLQRKSYAFNLFADFTGSYLWGNWQLSDDTFNSNGTQLYTNAGSRNFGAMTLQAFMGIGLDYKNFNLQAGYEVADWFDQYQVLDDGTGAHNNDLILQGFTLRIAFIF